MIGNFYITDNKREILFKFKDKAEENGISYSTLIVEFMEDYINNKN